MKLTTGTIFIRAVFVGRAAERAKAEDTSMVCFYPDLACVFVPTSAELGRR
jgi:hypothetical protein